MRLMDLAGGRRGWWDFLGFSGGLRRSYWLRVWRGPEEGFSGCLPATARDLGVIVLVFVRILRVFFVGFIKGAFTEEMTMFVTLPTAEGNMLVVQGL
jgi:hypothetical protein